MAEAPSRGRLLRILPLLVLLALVGIVVRFRSGGDPGRAPELPGPAGDGGNVLVVVSARDGQPLSEAILSRAAEADPLGAADAQGRIPLAPAWTGSAWVRCPGHVGVRLELPGTPGGRRLVLAPAGAVEIRFSDAAGLPVEGVEVELEPASAPVDADVLLARPIVAARRSDPEGRCLWPELVPGRPYRWRVRSAHRVEPDPLQSAEPDLFAPTAVAGGPFVSMDVETAPGETLRLKARVRAGASVSGILESSLPAGAAVVRVYDLREDASVERPSPGGALDRTVARLEAVGAPGEGGRFQFRELRAGRKKLTAYWTSVRGLHFASVPCVLQPGEDRDLGLLRAQEGRTLDLLVRVAGREGIPKEALERGLKAKVRLISRRAGGRGLPFDQWLRVPVDQSLTLTGLAEGPLLLEADIDEPERMPGVRWKGDRGQFDVPGVASAQLTLEARSTLTATLKAIYPGGSAGGDLNAFVFPAGGGEARVEGDRGFELPAFKPREGDPPGTASTTFAVPAGSFLVRVFSAHPAKPDCAGLFGEVAATFAASGTNEAVVSLGAGNTLRGRVVNRRGEPDRRLLRLQVEPYHGPNDLPVRVVAPDEDGRFVMRGVPPRRLMTFLFAEDEFDSGPGGAETPVDVRLEQ